MRLLTFDNHNDLSLTNDLLEAQTPPYAILSHTWLTSANDNAIEEITFQDLKESNPFSDLTPNINTSYDSNSKAASISKIIFCRTQARKDNLQHFWADTCCIDQANHTELSEAITSMFRWYARAVKCYVYLADVSRDSQGSTSNETTTATTPTITATTTTSDSPSSKTWWEAPFCLSRWFRRGWTLQELLAPSIVEFYSRDGEFLGDKASLKQLIYEITGIPISAICGEKRLAEFPVEERLRWTVGRETRRPEDRAYCLLGVFDVSMSLRYGEGERAWERLREKVEGKRGKNGPTAAKSLGINDAGLEELISWLAPSRPEEFQVKVSASRHPGTGAWFLKGPFQSWLRDTPEHSSSLLWITGKSGSGKTTLFSHIVETIKEFTSDKPTTAFAYHYCAFSDTDSQQLVNILGSLVAQLSVWQLSIVSDLKRIHERDKSRKQSKTLQAWQLEQILIRHIAPLNTVILLLDAVNESDDFSGTIACVLRLTKQLPNVKVLLTSTRSAASTGIQQLPLLIEVEMNSEEDIQTFIEASLADDSALGYLSSECRQTVRSTLLAKADQTFRWVHLTLLTLRRQRTGKSVLKALTHLPSGLTETYASMLDRIPAIDRPIAREVLLWLCFAMRPLTLLELSEAAVLEDTDTTLDQDSRLQRPEVILEICHGFVECDGGGARRGGEVKLAHSSVREYLLSASAKNPPTSDGNNNNPSSFFSFDTAQGNRALMRKSLTYLLFTPFTPGPPATRAAAEARRRAFPLLAYAAQYWGVHASFATDPEWALAMKLFATRSLPRAGNYGAWVNCLVPESYRADAVMATEPLYYAASFGMEPIVRALVSADAGAGAGAGAAVDLERPGGRYGSTALQVACFRGKKRVAEMLVEAGADFWSADPGSGEPAWFWAQSNGWSDLLQDMVRRRPEIAELTQLLEGDVMWARSFQELYGAFTGVALTQDD